MYARVTRSKVQPERVDEALSWFEQSALPQAESTPGFAGALELFDRETGQALTVTLWETAEARTASEEMAASVRSEAESEAEFEVLGIERFEARTFGL